MTVDNVTRLVRALGDDAQRSDSLSNNNSKKNVEISSAAGTADSSNQAVKFTSQYSASKAEGGDSAREARVAHFKAQFNAGILKPADSEKVAEKLAQELFV